MTELAFHASATRTILKVKTLRRDSRADGSAPKWVTQHHRGFNGVVFVKGERTKCGHFHQKASAARKCAEALGRRMVKEQS